MKSIALLLFFIGSIHCLSAQTTVKIIDSETKEVISYASVSVNNSENHISNDEGFFTISAANSNPDAVVLVSFFGYAGRQLTVGGITSNNSVIALKPTPIELDMVNVSGPPDAKVIMAEVKKNLSRNYGNSKQPVKDKLFIRKSTSFAPKILDLEITESSGFTKNNLKTINSEVTAFTSKLVSSPPRVFIDMLCNYYNSPTKSTTDGKTLSSKLDVVKATTLKDETRMSSLDDIEKVTTDLFLKHLDSTKYYRFKSGWFGTKDTISMRKDFNKKKKKNKEVRNELTHAKTSVTNFTTDQNFLNSPSLDFIKESDIYEYKYEGSVYMNDGNFAYVLTFKPRKGRANYKGKIYVSDSDFAVLRADYSLYEGRKLNSVNVKLLLGVKTAQNISRGTIIYKPNKDGEGYFLQYASEESGQYIYLNRPLKFIELAKSDKDVFALDVKIEGNMFEKTEYLNVNRSEIASADFDAVKEENFTYQKIRKYDASIWKDNAAIEPLEEMKQFSVPIDN
ncbi:MAG: carboxypeptidase-like regulatory domain-containing protein [Flavobacterium sp.]|uniref:carboxypeptidase-like regulatory domain-containing protein n=1 Tax=Flavobacterium sp. TaxID=239 RepID=UPI00120E3B6C|nr:carboxypeptidase-like regulatory domain-containing protein [Flavobacterium sp.]RZJ66030.1 MAG: carboxypeptidase-like regulatory domain-containing protein [Flavobacterium sp.]